MAGTSKRRPAPDQEHRDNAVAERGRNVLLDAGAGTGKTTILIDRLLRLLAPEDGADPIPIHRIAAVTFTRRAAGELRLRLRERLLAEAAREDPSVERRDALRRAIAGVDAAHVGTIHSFADRLLRLHPVEAGLSPSYEIVEDVDELVDETLHDLLHGAHTGTLGGMLRGTEASSRAAEVEETVRKALDAGVPAGSKRSRHRTVFGLRDLIAGFAEHRDVPPEDPAIEEFDPRPFREKADAFIDMVGAVPENPAAEGTKWLHETASLLRRYRAHTDPAKTYREMYWPLTHAPNDNRPRKKDEFVGDAAAYDAWKTYDGSQTGENKGRPALRDEILAPFRRWLAVRLVRTFPAVVALYERAKARRRVLDQIDLLVKLRDMLRKNPDIRGEYRRLFDHVLIDEFQDTDPLQ
ncbi:MAG: UvrD-helicase domain-containing protein, partial [Myxococcota bacterium]|nr:UvrD-helicase domain-containing protein [Myxococcota bacterium]